MHFLQQIQALSTNANIVKGLREKEGVAWYMESKFWPFILTFVQQWKQIDLECFCIWQVFWESTKPIMKQNAGWCNKWQEIKSITYPC